MFSAPATAGRPKGSKKHDLRKVARDRKPYYEVESVGDNGIVPFARVAPHKGVIKMLT